MHSGRAGFTLLELLVAMTILTFISLGVLSLLRYGSASWEHGRAFQQTAIDDQLLRELLRAKLEAVYPRIDKTDPTQARLDFAGDRHSLTFLAPAPAALGAGFARYSLRFVSPETSDAALEISALRELDTGESSLSNRSLVLRHLAIGQFAYFGSLIPSEAPAWHDSWLNQRELPAMIRVEISFPKDSRREWPDFIVAPRIARTADCVYDALSRDCRGG